MVISDHTKVAIFANHWRAYFLPHAAEAAGRLVMKTLRKASFYCVLGLEAAMLCLAPLSAQAASNTTQMAPDSHRFEQPFSDDDGKTWEPNFAANLTRIKS